MALTLRITTFDEVRLELDSTFAPDFVWNYSWATIPNRTGKGAEVNDVESIVPPSLADRIRSYHSAGSAWLQELPDLIARCVTQWDLTLLPP